MDGKMAERETAWCVINKDGEIWSGRKNNNFSNGGKLYKTAGTLKNSLRHAYLPGGCRVVRVRIEDAIEEEYNVPEFLRKASDLETP